MLPLGWHQLSPIHPFSWHPRLRSPILAEPSGLWRPPLSRTPAFHVSRCSHPPACSCILHPQPPTLLGCRATLPTAAVGLDDWLLLVKGVPDGLRTLALSLCSSLSWLRPRAPLGNRLPRTASPLAHSSTAFVWHSSWPLGYGWVRAHACAHMCNRQPGFL